MPDDPDFELSDFTPYLLNAAAEAQSLRFSRVYKDRYGMLRTEWRVLFHLGRYGAMSAREISLRAGIHKTKVSRAVAALERKRFLARRAAPRIAGSRSWSCARPDGRPSPIWNRRRPSMNGRWPRASGRRKSRCSARHAAQAGGTRERGALTRPRVAAMPGSVSRARRASISALSGIDGAVPGRVTEIAAVAVAKRSAASRDMPSASATASPPLNASPAPSSPRGDRRSSRARGPAFRRRTRDTPDRRASRYRPCERPARGEPHPPPPRS
jgi:hypothetical protein